jgi:hypothetical protein
MEDCLVFGFFLPFEEAESELLDALVAFWLSVRDDVDSCQGIWSKQTGGASALGGKFFGFERCHCVVAPFECFLPCGEKQIGF